MKNSKMTTLGQVFDKVNQMKMNYHDKFINVRDISFDSLETIKIGSDHHHLQPIAQQSISNRLGIPITYLKKCEPEIQAYNMNHWIEKEKNNELFFRFNSDEVRVIVSPRYIPLDNLQILEKLDFLGFGPETKVQVSLDSTFLQLNIPDSQKTFSVNGDKLTPGISIINSEVTITSLSLSAFYLRLVCTNGMCLKTQVSASYRHVSLKILSEFPQVINKLSYELDKEKDQFRISLQSPVSDPLSSIDTFNRQFMLSKEEREAVSWAWPLEEGETMFNIVNTYTRASQYEGISPHSSYRLQKVGGDILALVK